MSTKSNYTLKHTLRRQIMFALMAIAVAATMTLIIGAFAVNTAGAETTNSCQSPNVHFVGGNGSWAWNGAAEGPSTVHVTFATNDNAHPENRPEQIWQTSERVGMNVNGAYATSSSELPDGPTAEGSGAWSGTLNEGESLNLGFFHDNQGPHDSLYLVQVCVSVTPVVPVNTTEAPPVEETTTTEAPPTTAAPVEETMPTTEVEEVPEEELTAPTTEAPTTSTTVGTPHAPEQPSEPISELAYTGAQEWFTALLILAGLLLGGSGYIFTRVEKRAVTP